MAAAAMGENGSTPEIGVHPEELAPLEEETHVPGITGPKVVMDDDGASVERDLEEARRAQALAVAHQGSAGVQRELVGNLVGSVGPGGVHVAAAEKMRADRAEPFSQLELD